MFPGTWMDVNGAAIYGTSPAPEVETPADGDFVCYATKKDQHIFLHVIKWPEGPAKETVKIRRSYFAKAELLDAKLTGIGSQQHRKQRRDDARIPTAQPD